MAIPSMIGMMVATIYNMTDTFWVVTLAVRMLRAQCIVLPFMGYYILSGMMLQNIGRFGLATGVTIAENGTVFIPVLLIFSHLWQVNGIIFSKPVASAVALIYSFVIGTYAFGKYLCMEEGTEDEVLKSI